MLQGDAARLYSIKPTSDIDLADPALGSAWQRVLDGTTAWVLFSYAAPSKTRIALVAEGLGGPEVFAQHFAKSAVTYGAFHVTSGDRDKFLFVAHVGVDVGPMLRGKAAMHRQDVEAFFIGTVGGLHLDVDEGTAEVIVARAREMLGSEVAFPRGEPQL